MKAVARTRRQLITWLLVGIACIVFAAMVLPRMLGAVVVGSALAEPATALAMSTVTHARMPEVRVAREVCDIGIAEFELPRAEDGASRRLRHPMHTAVTIDLGELAIAVLASAPEPALASDLQVRTFRSLPAAFFRAAAALPGAGPTNTHLSLCWRALQLRRFEGLERLKLSRTEQADYLEALTVRRLLWQGETDAAFVSNPKSEAIVSWGITRDNRPGAIVAASTPDGRRQLHFRVTGPTHAACRDAAGTIAASLKFAPIDFDNRDAISEAVARKVPETGQRPE